MTVSLILVLLSLFTSVLLAQIDNNTNISCQCFGFLSDGKITTATIWRNVFLICCNIFILANSGEIPNKMQLVQSMRYFFILFILTQSLALSLENKILKERLLILTSGLELKPGDEIDELVVFSDQLDTNIIKPNNSKKKIIIFAVKKDCSFCKENLKPWRKIILMAKKETYNVVIISPDSINILKNYLQEYNLKYDYLSASNKELMTRLKIKSVPQTIFIVNGIVKKVLRGVLTSEDVDVIFRNINYSQ